MGDLAIYNEIAEYPSAWLRNLIAADLIAPGAVDSRSICDLTPAHGATTRVGDGGAVETRARVGEIKGYGNGIVATQAAAFIGCVMDAIERAA